MSPLPRQEGTALVGLMMVLFILTFLGTTAFMTSTTEMKISSNYTQSLKALYAAEAGLQELLAVFRRNPEGFLQKKTGAELSFPGIEPDQANGPGCKFWLVDLRYDPQAVPAYAEVVLAGKEVAQKGLCRIRATIFSSTGSGLDGVPFLFKVGMVTAGRLHLQGTSAIRTSIHANQGFFIDPTSLTEQLRDQQFSVTQSTDPDRSDYQKPVEVPVISDQGFQEYRNRAAGGNNWMLTGPQHLVLNGDQRGRLIFVDGDVTLTAAAVSGLTLVATGSITLEGSVVLKGGETIDSAFFAGGNLLLHDGVQLSAVFWANGTLVPSGTAKITGTVACQGSVSFGSGFQFERSTHISDIYFYINPTAYSFVVKGWSQL